MEADRLRDEIGSIAKVVTDSYARGQVCAGDAAPMTPINAAANTQNRRMIRLRLVTFT